MAQNEQNNGLQLQVASMDQFKELIFLQSETAPTDLVVKLPDGSEVVFQNYIVLAQAGTPPALTLEDGTAVPGQDIVSLIDNLNYDLIATAAGDAGEAPNGGGAAFASLVLDSDDDIGHGPYSNHIEINDEVGFDQYRGYTTDDNSGGGETPIILAANNVGDTFDWMMRGTSVDLADRPDSPSGAFGIELETQALSSPFADWDGMSVYLTAGETVTISHDDDPAATDYYIGLETGPTGDGGYDPLYSVNYTSYFPTVQIGTDDDLAWDYTSYDGVISYTATSDGWVYIGTGYEAYTGGSYYTDILIEGDDGVLAGTSGNDVLIGGTSDDLLIGGAGSDQFVFEDITLDGNDTIADFDFSAVPGLDNDVINLDALFDSIVPGADEATRLGYVDVDTTTGVLTVDTGSGTIAGFSVDLGVAGQSETDLFNNGNLVVDQS